MALSWRRAGAHWGTRALRGRDRSPRCAVVRVRYADEERVEVAASGAERVRSAAEGRVWVAASGSVCRGVAACGTWHSRRAELRFATAARPGGTR